MAKQIRMFAGVNAGLMFFDGSRVPPAPLGGVVRAEVNSNFALRIRIVRTDQFNKDGVTPKRLFRRIPIANIKNKANQRLVADLGFDREQVIDYINDQANKKSNEIDIQKDGALVGGGTTINFKGAIDSVTVQDDVASICIDQVGIKTSGGYVGTGVTLFDFRGSGVSTVTPITAGVSTIFIEGGELNASDLIGTINVNTQLSASLISYGGVALGLGDVDATPAFDLTDAHSLPYSALTGVPTHNTTINEFNWYQQYLSPGAGFSTAGPGITTIQPPPSENPYYYGTQLKPYQEMVWTHKMDGNGAYYVGLWGGSTSYDPELTGDSSLWEKNLAIRTTNGGGHHIDNSGTTYDSIGFTFNGGSGEYSAIDNNTTTLRLRYNGDSNKLELFSGADGETLVGIATAAVAEDGNPVTISTAVENNTTVFLPGITTVTYYTPQTSWKYLDSSKYLENNQHDKVQGVVYHETPLRRGEELLFSVGSEDLHVGVWDGGAGISSAINVNTASNWNTKWYYSPNYWSNANGSQKQIGTDLVSQVQTLNGTYSIRHDYDSQKLELHQINSAYDWKLSSANTGIGTTSQLIYFSTEFDTQASPPASLPGSPTVRSQDFTKIANTDPGTGPSVYHGAIDNDVWKSNRSLRPGTKLKFTVPVTASNQYWAVGYQGTSTQENSYGQGTGTFKVTTGEKIDTHELCTENLDYTGNDANSSGSTYAIPSRNMSWRYNSDNSWDIFDEDTDEVVLTGNNDLDGNDMYPHYMSVTNSTDMSGNIFNTFQWEWNSPEWYSEYRDWESGNYNNTMVGKLHSVSPLKTGASSIPTSGNGYYHLGNATYKVTWGEKLRPGQEFSWTQMTDNSNGANKNNMIIGVLNSGHDGFDYGIRFKQTGQPKNQSYQDFGFTISAGIDDTTACSGKSMRLQYEYGTNKLVCYSVSSGVRTKIGESSSALDGNPIFITLGGESTRLPSAQGVSVYGWECVHQPTNYYNPWNNWRIGGFPENQTGITAGDHSSCLAYSEDQVWRHKDGLASGYKMHWLTSVTMPNSQVGAWSSSNASSGLTNIENTESFFDWSWQTNTSEEIDALKGWTYNTGNSNYTATKWTDPNPGSTRISLRYHTNNTMDLYDESNSEVIITKTADNDGNPIYISWTAGGATNSVAQMQDDFFGGGDVGIALTTTAV